LCLWSQSNSKVSYIDSVIISTNSKITSTVTILNRLPIESVHYSNKYDISQTVKFDDNDNPIVIQKNWIDHNNPKDTSQTNSYYFSAKKLIKISCKVFKEDNILQSYQQIYLENKKVIFTISSDGQPFNPDSFLINYKSFLKRIKLRANKLIIDRL